MRKFLPAAAILAGAALTLGACNNPNDDAAYNDMADNAVTLPADNTIYTNDMVTNDVVTNDVVTNDVTP